MPISWNRITINGRPYIIEASARTEAGAHKYAAQMGLRFTRIPGRVKGRDYLILRPTGVMGLPEEKATGAEAAEGNQ